MKLFTKNLTCWILGDRIENFRVMGHLDVAI